MFLVATKFHFTFLLLTLLYTTGHCQTRSQEGYSLFPSLNLKGKFHVRECRMQGKAEAMFKCVYMCCEHVCLLWVYSKGSRPLRNLVLQLNQPNLRISMIPILLG